MDVSRRDFLKISGGTVLLGTLEGAVSPEEAQAQELRITDARVTTTVCPYCSVGCGILVSQGQVFCFDILPFLC